MRQTFLTILAICITSTLWSETMDYESMLRPIVRVRTAVAGGSGTIIYSEDRDTTGTFETYVLTNHHVIENAITVEEQWDSLLGKTRKKEERKTVTVERFDYDSRGVAGGRKTYDADIIAYNKDEDLALLKLRSKQKEPYVAKMILRADTESGKTKLLSSVTAIGCTLGHAPVVTRGEITSLNDEVENRAFWMASAQICFGNSGGAVFLNDSAEFIGIPSRVPVYGWGTAVAHMGLFIPPHRIYKWFESEHLTFLYDKDVKPSVCFEKRKELREKAKLEDNKE